MGTGSFPPLLLTPSLFCWRQLWEVKEDADGNPDVKHVDTLTAHNKTVNVVRFSPGGDLLASGVRFFPFPSIFAPSTPAPPFFTNNEQHKF